MSKLRNATLCGYIVYYSSCFRLPPGSLTRRSKAASGSNHLWQGSWKLNFGNLCKVAIGFILMLMSQMSNTYWCRHKWTPPLVGADIRHTEDLEPSQRFEEMFNNCFSDLFAGECLTCPAHSASPVLKGPWTTATSSFTSHCAVWRVNRRVAQLGPVIDFHWLKFTNRSGTIQIICA